MRMDSGGDSNVRVVPPTDAELQAAGAGGSSGGAAEVRLAAQGEQELAGAKGGDRSIWEAMRKFSAGGEGASTPLNAARKRSITDHSSLVFGEASQVDWNAVQSPRVHIPGMDVPHPPRAPRKDGTASPKIASPRLRSSAHTEAMQRLGWSPRQRWDTGCTGLFSREMQEDAIQDTEALPCKAASRGHYQRNMATDPTDLFGAYLQQRELKIGADKVNSPRRPW